MPSTGHIVIALVVLGSIADAAPRRRGKLRLEHEPKTAEHAVVDEADIELEEPEEEDEEIEQEEDEEEAPVRKRRKRQAFDDTREPADTIEAVAPKPRNKSRRWHLAIGPNVWAASVDAKVAVGAKNITTAIDFFDLSRNTKLGVPILVEARYKRFSFVGDVLYGVIGVTSEPKELGPLQLSLDGTVKNLSLDAIGGYRVYGKDDSAKISVDARAGLRYQRMAISGSLGLSGNEFTPAAIVDSSADAVAGARVFVRPTRWLFLQGNVDQSVFGSSTSTWSASGDANLQIKSRVLFSAGYRSLTQQKSSMTTVMHGPKVALQILF